MSEKPTKYVTVEDLILVIRGQRVILDTDIALLYGVSTKRLNEQIRRNRNKFPSDFVFRLNVREKEEVVANCDHLRKLRFSPVFPFAFTEHGTLMAANVLNSAQAGEMSVFIVRAFIELREKLAATASLEKRLEEIEKTLIAHDVTLRDIYQKIKPLLLTPPSDPPKRKIGFRVEESRAKYRMRKN